MKLKFLIKLRLNKLLTYNFKLFLIIGSNANIAIGSFGLNPTPSTKKYAGKYSWVKEINSYQ